MDAAIPARVAGLDWASRLHAVCVLDLDGQVRARFDVPHTGGELRGLTRRLVRLGVGQVAIERPDGPVVEALLAAGLEVVVIPGRQVKALRGRYGTAGNKDDRFDATCSPTRCAPTGTGWRRYVLMRPRPPPCGWSAGPASRWWPPGWHSPTSSGPTSRSASQARRRCSATSTAQSRWPFCVASPR